VLHLEACQEGSDAELKLVVSRKWGQEGRKLDVLGELSYR
jgi:hypothetical protein